MKQKLISIGGVSISNKEIGFTYIKGFEHYGRLPFVDGKTTISFSVLDIDAIGAVCGDPRKCVFANTLRRVHGNMIHGASVGKAVFHMLRKGEDGQLRSTRYTPCAKLRKAIDDFDKTGKWNLPEGNYELLPPKGTSARGVRKPRFDIPASGSGKGPQRQKGIMSSPTRQLNIAIIKENKK